MIVGLEFDARDDLVALRLFVSTQGARDWVRSTLPAAHSRSVYDVAATDSIGPYTRDVPLALHALRHGRLVADRDPRVGQEA